MPDGPTPPNEKQPIWSRYDRVKEILNTAAGQSTHNYQGQGRFWELPIEEFLSVVIYGVRMIAAPSPAGSAPPPPAAATASSCCHAPKAPEATAPKPCHSSPPNKARTPGRGAASGLIIGLKGQCPFDGTQFPRLPWDGAAVSASDIQFISDWIDDGCPATDPPISVSEANIQALARGDAEHPLSTGPTNLYQSEIGAIKARKNINCLTFEELDRFRKAVAWMKSFDPFPQDNRSFAYWALIHGNLCQHGWEEFLPWHRPYLSFFEQHLNDFDDSVALPYWDWTDESGNAQTPGDLAGTLFEASQANPVDNGIIPQAYRCFMTQEGWENLKGKVPANVLDQLKAVVTAPPPAGKPEDFLTYNSGLRLFEKAGIVYGQNPDSDRAILCELGKINPLWHRLRWPGGDQNIIFEAYPTIDDINRIMQLTDFFQFGSGPMNDHFFGALENIHNLIHNFSGGANPKYVMGQNPNDRKGEPQYGDMVNPGVTAFDPIFWGHHSNVDRLWWRWQQLHPGINPDIASSILPPWSMNVGQTLDISKFGYEYLKETHVYPTSDQMPIACFKSAKTPVMPQTLADHSTAEVRLRNVQYRTRGGYHIRVFLNAPEADGSTPLRGNDNYVGQVSSFTGFCVGGPGHCDPPPDQRRKFDVRPRARKTPGNIRLDATDNVKKLAARGDTAFQISLVPLNTDGTPAVDALVLDAVSLVFHE